LAILDEARRISERLGLSDPRRIDDYAGTLFSIGDANRGIGSEQAACEQYSKARGFYRKLGPSSSGAPMLAQLEKEMATCPQR
jgi:hypothetical protein